MKSNYFPSVFALFSLVATVNTFAAGSMLRVICEGDDTGAAVSVNGQFKGECPVDIQVAPGTLKLRVEKSNALQQRVFEQEIRMGDGVVKRVEAILTTRLTEAGQKAATQQEAERQAEAARIAEQNRRLAADRSLQEQNRKEREHRQLCAAAEKKDMIFFEKWKDCRQGNFFEGSINACMKKDCQILGGEYTHGYAGGSCSFYQSDRPCETKASYFPSRTQ